MLWRIISFLLLPILLAAMSACDQDPLGLAEKAVVGKYRLLQWEDETTYFLVDHPASLWSEEVLHDPVVRIGWNPNFIVVDRPGDGSPRSAGLFVIDVKRGLVQGPVSKEQLARDPRLAGIKLIGAQEAWQNLPWKPPWSDS